NWQTRFLAGLHYHHLYPHLSSERFNRAVLTRAVANLTGRYSCFGMQERFDESLDLLQRRLGWRQRVLVSRQKQTGSRPPVESLDAGTRSALRAANRLDCELYEVALEHFEAQLREA